MNRPARTRTDPDKVRTRILEVAEAHFRHIGYQKTSVADIASELGMSTANVYRFFPSKGAIKESICGLVVNEVAEIASRIAQSSAPAAEKLIRLLTAVHHHGKTILVKEQRMHDLIVAAMHENWAVTKAHIERMVTILEAIIREGIEAGEFKVEDPAEAARAVHTAFTAFFHPILIEHCLEHGEETEAGLRAQIHFSLKALGKPNMPSWTFASLMNAEVKNMSG
ncbi:TetR/AcrR family transcriptional regulator [Mesorhizobium cantuariense]|uniref:TetR/AcrR family transcriptional regulator n=1 Tax=Mesorhizobium cantuariense TaxID=1300275 RepID=A0ABV7MUH2_9HYPH